MEGYEQFLDVVNIVIIRQQMEVELQRLQELEAQQGWFSWAWKGFSAQDTGAGADLRKLKICFIRFQWSSVTE